MKKLITMLVVAIFTINASYAEESKEEKKCWLEELPFGIIIGKTKHADIRSKGHCIEHEKNGTCKIHSLKEDGGKYIRLLMSDDNTIRHIAFSIAPYKWARKGLKLFKKSGDIGMSIDEAVKLVKTLPIEDLEINIGIPGEYWREDNIKFNINNYSYILQSKIDLKKDPLYHKQLYYLIIEERI